VEKYREGSSEKETKIKKNRKTRERINKGNAGGFQVTYWYCFRLLTGTVSNPYVK
jgi:hypothetical protein